MSRILKLLVIAVLCGGSVHPIRSEERVLPIVPAPQVITFLTGSVSFVPSQTSIHLSVRDTAAVMPAIADLCSTSVALYGKAPSFARKGRLLIRAGVFGDDPVFDRLCATNKIAAQDQLGDEGYHLLIEPGLILVAGRSARGVFYGLQSLHQLLRAAASAKGMLPAVRVSDWPDLRVRAVMDDISRGPVPTPAYFRQQIRRCAELKVNTMSYYTEHVVATRRHPEFAPPGAALSIDEWRELAAFARSYHIDLIGNFQSFGHFDKILATPRYTHLADSKSLLSPAIAESYAFLRDIYEEMVPAFSSPFFNVNCDETFDLGRGRSKALVDSLGAGRVYLGHILKLREILRGLGVRMIVWGDILLEHPEVIDDVPKDVLIGTWTYDSLADFRRFITPFTSRGFDVLVTPGVLNSSNVLPNFRQSFANIRRFVRDGVAENVLGALTTVWDDGGTAQFMRDWYGVAYASDQMWNSDTLDSSFPRRFDTALYGDHRHALSRGIDTLMRLADLAPTDGMSDRNLWQPVIPAPGEALRLDLTDWERVLSIAGAADTVFRSGRQLAWREDLDAMRFVADLYAASARLRLGIRDAARMYAVAVQEQNHNREDARRKAVSALNIVAGLADEYSCLKTRAVSTWLMESRLHALDSVERSYDDRIRDLTDVEKLVRAALAGFERGEPLPAPVAVRLGIVESTGWFFRDWLVTGPIDGNELTTDYLTPMGGEQGNVRPAVTQEFLFAGKTYRWSRLSARTAAEIDFSTLYPQARLSTLYAYATVESPAAVTVPALLGFGGGVRVFINGSLVFEREGRETLAVDADTVSLSLRKGINNLLIKVSGGTAGDWGFSWRLTDSSVRNRKNRYRIVSEN